MNLSGSGSEPPAPAPELVVALAVAEIVLVVAAPPVPPVLLELLVGLSGSEEHAATTAPPREAPRTIEVRARRVTRPG